MISKQKQSTYLLAGIASLLTMTSASTLMGTSVQQVEESIKSNDRVVIMFTSSSCHYCRYLKPLFNQLKTKRTDIVFKIINASSSLKSKYGFRTVPTVVYFKNGKEVGRHGSNNGRMTVAGMQKYLNRIA